ncbi:MAG: hypothetical protein ACRDPA_32375 [Solirubrobacteraceae bacterium]
MSKRATDTDERLVKVVGGQNQAGAEFLQGMLLEEGVPSVLRRAPGLDVPGFVAAGRRDALVPTLAGEVARQVPMRHRRGR